MQSEEKQFRFFQYFSGLVCIFVRNKAFPRKVHKYNRIFDIF